METHPAIEFTYIRKSGPDSPRNDTASIAELNDGTLVAAWHRYKPGPEGPSDFGLAAIAAADSHDGGYTWVNERIIVDVAEGDLNVQAPALRLMPDGELLLICNRAHARDSTSMLLYTSKDNGKTFDVKNQIWEKSVGQRLQGGAASLLRLNSGRLLIPFHGGIGDQWSQHNAIGCYFSDHAGDSWELANGIVDLPMRGAMEASVAELESGELCMSIRTQLGSVFLSRSIDEGESWSLAQSTNLKAPESCTCLRRVPGTNRLTLFWNDSLYDPTHHHYGMRTPLSVAISDDKGTTFKKVADIDGGDAMLTNVNCTFTSGGNALVTYLHVEDCEVVNGVYKARETSGWGNGHIGLKCAIIQAGLFT
jgi:sialidase-1